MRSKLCLILMLCCCFPLWSAQPPAAVEKARQAERLLLQAEQHPATSSSLIRRACESVPPGACPSLTTAANKPTHENLTQARREVSACERAMTLGTGGVGASSRQCGGRSPHAVLHAVLSRSEFGIMKQETPHSGWIVKCLFSMVLFLQHVLGVVMGLLGKLFAHIHPSWVIGQAAWFAHLSGAIRLTLCGILLACVLFLLSLLVNRILLRALNRSVPTVRAELLDGASPVSRKQEPTFWERSLQEAEAYWQQGDQRKALRAIYWACLVLLDTRGVLRFDEGRANGEVLCELRRQGLTGVHEHFRPIIRCFDRSWYGFLDVSREEFLRVMETSRQFRGVVVKEP